MDENDKAVLKLLEEITPLIAAYIKLLKLCGFKKKDIRKETHLFINKVIEYKG